MLKRITSSFFLLLAMLATPLLLTGCEGPEGPAEEQLEEAGEEVGDEIDDATTD